ncbi:lysozyme [Streptomyces sp. NPDC052301]|uniref:lysozyme n=1 Tax=Streptomyces sp. NPDC052301 TaxID=3365687 RepID=UPI0037D3DE0F
MARERTPARRRAGALAAATAALALTGTATLQTGTATALTGTATTLTGTATAQSGTAATVTGTATASTGTATAPTGAAADRSVLPPWAGAVTDRSDLPARAARPPRGPDVSSYQKHVDWPAARTEGARFVYVKATESTDYRNPYFHRQYTGARTVGLIRGAYHFALPDRSSGARQAAYFVRHGGDWRADGWTLPPALDIEDNPYSRELTCYGLGQGRMVRWIRSFSDEIERETGRRPVIYTTTRWWRLCTGDSRAFSTTHALWIARHGTSRPGKLPGGWRCWTFWQYDTDGGLPGDQNLFNGSASRLRDFARGR